MTERSPPYGASPAGPSTRVSETELLALETVVVEEIRKGVINDPEATAQTLERLVGEIRRLRTMLIGLEAKGKLADSPELLIEVLKILQERQR